MEASFQAIRVLLDNIESKQAEKDPDTNNPAVFNQIQAVRNALGQLERGCDQT